MLKLRDIATHAGVSPTTVSVVLNDRHETLQISEKTRLKVLQAAEELGYRTNHMARAMRTGNTKMLGILGGKASEEQVGQMLEGALEAADAQGYTLKILRLHSVGTAQQMIRRCSELRLMGMMALHLPEEVLEELHHEAQKYATPLVLLDARSQTPGIVQVVSDDAGGVVKAVDHLVQLGHTRIAFMSGEDKTLGGFSAVRREAFLAAMEKHLIAVIPELVVEGSFRFRDPSLVTARVLLNLPVERRPTAILCSSDMMGLATLQVAREVGLEVPTDLSVVGFGNLMFSEFGTPPLTTVNQPFEAMGAAAVDALLRIISERQQDEAAPGAPAAKSEKQLYGVRADHLRDSLAGRSVASSQGEISPSVATSDNIIPLPTQLVERQSTASPQK